MRVLLLPVAVLLTISKGGSSDGSVSTRIEAIAGQTVTLPCHINVVVEHPTIEWSKEGPGENFAFLYRDSREDHKSKHSIFWSRTSLNISELTNGNVSLRMSNVQLSDAGKYTCRTIQNGVPKDTTVELFVGAVSEPKLAIVPAEGVGLTLQCDSNCWYPEPQITFFDDRGNDLSAENPKRKQTLSGCWIVTRKLTVQTHTNRISCRVYQPQIDKKKDTEIYIPGTCMKSCDSPITIAVAVTVVVGASCTIGFFLCKKKCNCGWGNKLPLPCQSSGQRQMDKNTNHYRQRSQDDNSRNATTEQQTMINKLRLSLRENEEIIRNLTKELNDLRSKQSPTEYQLDQSTNGSNPFGSSPVASKPVDIPQHHVPQDSNPKPPTAASSKGSKSGTLPKSKASKPGVAVQSPETGPPSHRGGPGPSSPALKAEAAAVAPTPSSASVSNQKHVFHSKSLSPRRQNKPQHKYTASAPTSNRFSPLENLRDDSEPLLQ